MELVYLWVDDNKNIKKQGFNFSPRFECKFFPEYEKDEEGKDKLKDNCKLQITEKKDYVNIFPENINVTAIVGENGSGKSSLIESSLSFYGPKLGIIFYNNILSIHSSHKILINNKTEIEHSTNNGSLKQEKITLRNFSWDILKYEQLDGFAGYLHVDLNILTSLFNTFHEPRYLNLYSYHKLFILKLVDVYIKYQPTNFEYIPKKINVKFQAKRNDDEWDFDEINSQIDELHFYSNKKEKEDQQKDIEKQKEISKKTVKKYLEKYTDNLESNKEFTLNEFETILNEYKLINELFSNFNSFSIEVYNENDVKLYDLSHGERSILLSNLLIYENIMKSVKEDILFLLDEPDISLHPQWQKEYIHQLIHTFKKIDKKIHFVITSHSPFIISDLPKENVIFLENGEQKYPFKDKQTFGANIHTLLSHGFFMDNGLMGEFAKGKINQIKEFYDDVIKYKDNKDKLVANRCIYDDKKDEFWKIQEIIGEPFLKTIMGNYLLEIEKILFEEKAKENEIDRFIEKIGKNELQKHLDSRK